ncbi:hypothetical protein AB4Z39_33250 [Mycobacterium adipatum]|uniref:hypothetical protein n=1 Tax=Mycobacterium adipatum TaxID=1682113 RepID=UPI0034E076DF
MTHTHPTPAPSALAALRVTRNEPAFHSWWSTLTDTTDIVEAIHALHSPRTSDVESSLHWLMLSVFQGAKPVTWLEVEGLNRTAHVSHVALDIEVAHDNDGDTVGVDVVLSLHVAAPDGSLVATTPSAYVQWPAKEFAPTGTEPVAALAEILDTALNLVNSTIAEQDRFADLARTPHEDRARSAAEDTTEDDQDDEDDEPEIEHCRDCGRITRIDDEPVDTDAADGFNGSCGSCADRREGQGDHDD